MIKRTFTSAAFIAVGIVALSIAAQAAVVDLIHNDDGSITNSYGTTLFAFTQPQPTGTGVIQPFLRVQANGTERGYNTSGGTPFDDKAGPWTHDVQFSDLRQTLTTVNGAQFYKIMVDLNEPNGSRSTISLESLQFYTSATGGATTLDLSTLGTLRYDLDAGGDNTVLLDAGRNHGSGSGDAFFYIPVGAFAGVSTSDFIYMYVMFGGADTTTGGGFEEFALVYNMTAVPEVGALFPILGLLVAVVSTHTLRRRRKARVCS